MKLTKRLTVIKDVFQSKLSHDVHCFIDDKEVELKECGFELDEKPEMTIAMFWDNECENHPTSSHCKLFD